MLSFSDPLLHWHMAPANTKGCHITPKLPKHHYTCRLLGSQQTEPPLPLSRPISSRERNHLFLPINTPPLLWDLPELYVFLEPLCYPASLSMLRLLMGKSGQLYSAFLWPLLQAASG